ncbi:hypothetical protein BDZ89DRAFT_1068521 [Hymenopellis radicata]|nr:hypothetical protein BDZ89DRAFT_1068521 [Hymenopellis radicata]
MVSSVKEVSHKPARGSPGNPETWIFESFKFPSTTQDILLTSSGSYAAGTLTISQRRHTSSKDVRINVGFTCGVSDIQACSIKEIIDSDKARGIEIVTPHSKETPRPFNFHVAVSFPADGAQTKSLSVAMPHFACAFKGPLRIKTISIKKLRSITIDDTLYCNKFLGVTSGHIVGRFDAQSGLHLKTGHGDIKVEVRLRETAKRTGRGKSTVHLRSHSGKITAVMDSTRSDAYHLAVDASTAKRPLKLNLNGMAGSPELKLLATATNAPATVMLPRSFAGEFSVRATDHKPAIQLRHMDDRSVQIHSAQDESTAKAWGVVELHPASDENSCRGSATVVTEKGQAKLII